MQVQRMEHEDMFDNILAIAMEVVRLLTFQPGRAPPVRGRKAPVNHSDTGRVR
jgi:hypothetical protein